MTALTKVLWLLFVTVAGAVGKAEVDGRKIDQLEERLQVCQERWPLPKPEIINPDGITHN